MIFNLYPKVVLKVGDSESYVFDRSSLMFTEVVEIERASGLSFGEWQSDLGRYSLAAVGALLHVLRKRAGVASDFETMQFAAADLDVVPLHEDGSEFTAEEVAADLARRLEEAKRPGPTSAAGSAASVAGPPPGTTASTSPTSRSVSTSVPGSGSGSRGGTSRSSRRTPTRS